jgi:hypothetical protein
VSQMTEEQLSRINTGKAAFFAMQHISPLIAERSVSVLNEMKQLTRHGPYDSVKIQGLLERLLAYDDLITMLNAQINVAESATNEIGDPI